MATDLSADSMQTQRQLDVARAAEKAKEKPVESSPRTSDPVNERALLAVETAQQARVEAVQNLVQAVDAPSQPDSEDVDAEAESSSTPTAKPEDLGFFASLGAGLKSAGTWISDHLKEAFDWIKKTLGFKDRDEELKKAAREATRIAEGAFATSREGMTWLHIHSWDELLGISDLNQRVVQAALYAYATDMDCFTKDGNHCSGWCDSVFTKAGLNLYDKSKRIFVGDYKDWEPQGTLQGLSFQPGDSILYYNGNATSGFHQDIVLSSQGPDSKGDYQVTTVGQTASEGTSGTRKIRTFKIEGKNIKVVVRPTA